MSGIQPQESTAAQNLLTAAKTSAKGSDQSLFGSGILFPDRCVCLLGSAFLPRCLGFCVTGIGRHRIFSVMRFLCSRAGVCCSWSGVYSHIIVWGAWFLAASAHFPSSVVSSITPPWTHAHSHHVSQTHTPHLTSLILQPLTSPLSSLILRSHLSHTHQRSQKKINLMQVKVAKAVLRRHWIQAKHLPGTLRALRNCANAGPRNRLCRRSTWTA